MYLPLALRQAQDDAVQIGHPVHHTLVSIVEPDPQLLVIEVEQTVVFTFTDQFFGRIVDLVVPQVHPHAIPVGFVAEPSQMLVAMPIEDDLLGIHHDLVR